MKAYRWSGKAIRVIAERGTMWFVAQDVCEALGLENPSMVVKTQVKNASHKETVKVETNGGPQEFIAVNDIGLYEIILSARTPKAKEFEAWVSGTLFPDLGLKPVGEKR